MKLKIENFAQIADVDFDIGDPGDLTLLVGQQATGKSLALQWLKLATDAQVVRRDWEQYGSNWREPKTTRALDLFFGEGLSAGWNARSRVQFDGQDASPDRLLQRRPFRSAVVAERTYYVPAHRALLLADGWPKNFQQHGTGTPYVARAQSERLARWLGDAGDAVFPVKNRLPAAVRQLFDKAVFHGSTLAIDRSSPQRRLVLQAGDRAVIPFMAWTAGQREFVPLLLALYELMPAGAQPRMKLADRYDIDTVVLEEPELGLHPRALFAVGVVALHLMARGYRVVISTHSPLMVDFAWAINRFRTAHAAGKATDRHLLEAFELGVDARTRKLAAALFNSRARTYYLSHGQDGRVRSKDITDLSAVATDPDQSSWGELLRFSTHLAEMVGNLDLDFSAVAH